MILEWLFWNEIWSVNYQCSCREKIWTKLMGTSQLRFAETLGDTFYVNYDTWMTVLKWNLKCELSM